jgi:mannitol 2-dehydrogenase
MSVQKSTPAVGISNRTLSQLSGGVAVPRYQRAGVVPGIVHIGVGGFNRSHLAVYLDDLLGLDGLLGIETAERRGKKRWGEFGIGLMAGDRAIHEALVEQDYLYGVLERDAQVENYRVIGSLVGHHFAPEDSEAVIRQLASPECEIVSLTVTEGGYFQDDGGGPGTPQSFRADDAAIRRDLENPGSPATWVGYVAAAAERRRQAGGRAFTLMSCDNLQGNGEAARRALLGFAELRGGGLRQWIEARVAFPNSMVDRITPRTSEADRERIAERFGVRDRTPVVTEPFRQWVLEDEFAAGRPEWEQAGVKMTAEVAPYEKTKMRLLNGGHFCIAYFAALLGMETVAQAVEDGLLRELLMQFLAEVRMTLRELPGIDLEEYARSVVERFSNPAIGDQIARICGDGPAKVTKFILPTLRDLLEAQERPRILPLVIASWMEYEENAEAGEADTEKKAEARRAAVAAVMGGIGVEIPEIVATIKREQENLQAVGVRATLRKALRESGSR